MVTLAYHLPYTGLLRCDEPSLTCSCKGEWGGLAICGHVDHYHGRDHVLHCGPRDMISLLNFNEDLYLGQVVPMGF